MESDGHVRIGRAAKHLKGEWKPSAVCVPILLCCAETEGNAPGGETLREEEGGDKILTYK